MADTPVLRSDARRNYEQVLTAAQEVFVKEGIDASLREVARQAGVGIGTLYRHFPTREALLDALLRAGVDQLRQRADVLAREQTPDRALLTWLHEFVERSSSYRGVPASIAAALHNKKSDLYASCEAMRLSAAQLLARAQQAGAVRSDVTATEVFAMASGVALVADQMAGGKAIVDRLLALAMTGLARR
ncbi:TetR/AcrR family transcriptional regulator [Actinocrispum wychmicini]|uniref:TetR family transcriptional regulator n=1 Tax=Actinocrispum wychmicini TaxID=1213861 RepID=A0A4R2JDY9_9PSEU|nr:TetR/AcrR family transcriptional regulator [Actinocrispum wychmicini]TCO55076.1 TetR family transcriptional regulator [Actinocrispum wychmicini]